MIRYLCEDLNNPGIWNEVVTNKFYHKGDIITLPNGNQYRVKFIEGKAFNGKH